MHYQFRQDYDYTFVLTRETCKFSCCLPWVFHLRINPLYDHKRLFAFCLTLLKLRQSVILMRSSSLKHNYPSPFKESKYVMVCQCWLTMLTRTPKCDGLSSLYPTEKHSVKVRWSLLFISYKETLCQSAMVSPLYILQRNTLPKCDGLSSLYPTEKHSAKVRWSLLFISYVEKHSA
jgi:hypothetical protein